MLVTRENLSIAANICSNLCAGLCYDNLDVKLKEIGISEQDIGNIKEIVSDYFKRETGKYCVFNIQSNLMPNSGTISINLEIIDFRLFIS